MKIKQTIWDNRKSYHSTCLVSMPSQALRLSLFYKREGM